MIVCSGLVDKFSLNPLIKWLIFVFRNDLILSLSLSFYIQSWFGFVWFCLWFIIMSDSFYSSSSLCFSPPSYCIILDALQIPVRRSRNLFMTFHRGTLRWMMMAVSLLAAGVTDFSNSMKMVGDTMSIFSREDQLLSLSRENKDQIRKTMMQHEELFKEQVWNHFPAHWVPWLWIWIFFPINILFCVLLMTVS